MQLQGFISGLAAGPRHDRQRDRRHQQPGHVDRRACSTNIRAPLAQDIKDVTGLVGVLNANSGTVKYVLQQLPGTVGALIRTASYGSWFNFYLCSATVEIPTRTAEHIAQPARSKQARCH